MIKAKELYKGLAEFFSKRPADPTFKLAHNVSFSVLYQMLTAFYASNPKNGMTRFIAPLVKHDGLGQDDFTVDPIWHGELYDLITPVPLPKQSSLPLFADRIAAAVPPTPPPITSTSVLITGILDCAVRMAG
ncbi:MAG TPA: hypothetical protein VFP97_12530 [Chitinophagaceae bacterium]|nr:hypothetical protein [Chitinophagaceae bacterium]